MSFRKVRLEELHNIEGKTKNQQLALQYWKKDKNLMLLGAAGTGKSLLSIYMGLKEVLSGEKECLYIIRSVVPTRDMGFLKGDIEEKIDPYKAVYRELSRKLGVNFDQLDQTGQVRFETTSFIRGRNLDNCVVIVDECQNLNFHELDSVITRLNDYSRIIFSGDSEQTDFTKESDRKGLQRFRNIIECISSFEIVEFTDIDIVRGGLVREYLIAKAGLCSQF